MRILQWFALAAFVGVLTCIVIKAIPNWLGVGMAITLWVGMFNLIPKD